MPSDALPCAVSPAVTSCGVTWGARTTSRGPRSTGLGAGRGRQDVPPAVWNWLARSHQPRGHQFLACPCAAGERRVSPPCCGLQIILPRPPAAASSSPARPCMRLGTPPSPTAGDIPGGVTPIPRGHPQPPHRAGLPGTGAACTHVAGEEEEGSRWPSSRGDARRGQPWPWLSRARSSGGGHPAEMSPLVTSPGATAATLLLGLATQLPLGKCPGGCPLAR